MSQATYLQVDDDLQIPFEEFEISYARSGGPGGQNVNKVSSKVLLRWSVVRSASLPEVVRQRFIEKFSTRITTDGDLLITSQKFRDQRSNFESCLEKLRVMLDDALNPPKLRRATKVTAAMRRRRVENKQEQSNKKQQRRRPSAED